jgi:hypothetical protein
MFEDMLFSLVQQLCARHAAQSRRARGAHRLNQMRESCLGQLLQPRGFYPLTAAFRQKQPCVSSIASLHPQRSV